MLEAEARGGEARGRCGDSEARFGMTLVGGAVGNVAVAVRAGNCVS
jgi:hypothetical protein